MSTAPELKLAIEEKRGVMDLFTLWMPRIALVLAFVFIGGTKFNNDPRGEWVKLFERIGWGQWFRYFTGAMQVTGALLMLTPWTDSLKPQAPSPDGDRDHDPAKAGHYETVRPATDR